MKNKKMNEKETMLVLREPSKKGGDLDILVRKDSFDKIKEDLLSNEFIYCGWECPHTLFKRLYLSLKISHFQVGGLTHSGIIYFKENHLLNKRNSEKIRRMIALLMHLIVDKNPFHKRWKELKILRDKLNKKEKEKIKEILEEEYGKLSKKILKFFYKKKTNQKESSILKWKILIKKAKLHQIFTLPFILFSNQLYKIKKSREIIKISFMGVDGSGKTTTLNKVYNFLEKNGISCTKSNLGVYHERSWLMEFLGKFVKKEKNKEKAHNRLENNFEKKGPLKNLVRILDIFIRYKKSIREARNKKIKVILFDGYFYDIILQSKLDFLTKLLLKISPRPDFLFYLKNEPKIIYKRKKERKLETIKKQMKKFEEEINLFIKPTIILSDNIRDTKKRILKKLNCRKFLCKI